MGVNRNDAAEIEALEWAQARLIASKLQQWMRAAHEVSRLLQKLRCIAIQGEALIGDLSTATAIATLVAGPVVGEEIQAAATVGRTAPSSHQGVTQTSDHELMTSGDIILRDSHLRIVCWRSGKGYMQLERRCDKATDRAFQVSNSYVRSIRDEYFGELRARHAGWAAVFGYSFVSTSVNAPARSEETRGTAEVFMVSPSLTKPTPSVLTDHIVHPLRQPPTTRVAGNHQVGDTHAAHNDENMLDESGRPPLEGKDVLFIYHQLWPEGGNHGGELLFSSTPYPLMLPTLPW